MAQLSDLIGQTLIDVQNNRNKKLIFTTKEGNKYKLYHDQDCCESVYIESIVGDLNDLLNTPLLKAEEVVSKNNSNDYISDYQDSFTWTFYKFATIKGYVDIRWLGESNGYYSESVDFMQVN